MNDLLKRQAAKERLMLRKQQNIVEQLFVDCIMIALHKRRMRFDTIRSIIESVADEYETYIDAFGIKCKEADYVRVKLDETLREICEGHLDHFAEFKERYPDAKDIDGIGRWKG